MSSLSWIILRKYEIFCNICEKVVRLVLATLKWIMVQLITSSKKVVIRTEDYLDR